MLGRLTLLLYRLKLVEDAATPFLQRTIKECNEGRELDPPTIALRFAVQVSIPSAEKGQSLPLGSSDINR